MIFRKSLNNGLMSLVTTNETVHKTDTPDPFSVDSLLHAFKKCKQGSIWKGSVQYFESDLLAQCVIISNLLRNQTYTTEPYNEFILNERGKLRHIKAVTIRDRVVLRSLCDNVLTPATTPKVIYDNFASLEKRGISFARKRFLRHLRSYLRNYGTKGYILQIDFSKFFDNLDHESVKREFEKIVPYNFHWLINLIINSFGGSKGMEIGSQISQIAGVYFPYSIDNYCKIRKKCLYYGRYMDDIYVIHPEKQFLTGLLNDIQDISNQFRLVINAKKTHINPLEKPFVFLQSIYKIKDNGKVLYSPTQKGIRRERKRLVKLKNKWNQGQLSLSEIHNSFKSWSGNLKKNYPHSSFYKLQFLNHQFKQLFGELS